MKISITPSKSRPTLLTISEISVLLRARQEATYAELTTAVYDAKVMTEGEQIQLAEELLRGGVPKDMNSESSWQEWPRSYSAFVIPYYSQIITNGL